VKAADRTFAGQHEAGQDSGITEATGEQLVHANGGLDIATALGTNAGQDPGCAFGVTTDDIFRVMQSVDEIDFVLERLEGGESGAQFELTVVAFGPPFRRVYTVTEEEEGESFGRLIARFDTQQPSGFQPWQGDRRRSGLEDNPT